MLKIIVTGPESSGKTTLCKSLSKHFKIPYSEEFARKYLDYLVEIIKLNQLFFGLMAIFNFIFMGLSIRFNVMHSDRAASIDYLVISASICKVHFNPLFVIVFQS